MQIYTFHTIHRTMFIRLSIKNQKYQNHQIYSKGKRSFLPGLVAIAVTPKVRRVDTLIILKVNIDRLAITVVKDMVLDVRGSITGSVKSDAASPKSRHRYDDSSEQVY